MFLEKAIYSSHAKSTTTGQDMTIPAVALIVEAGKLMWNCISNNTRIYFAGIRISTESFTLSCRRGSHYSQTFVCS